MIPFIDLKAQQARIRPQIDAAIARVLARGQYILGPEVAELEKQLAKFCGARFALTCASETDALLLPLMAWAWGGTWGRCVRTFVHLCRDGKHFPTAPNGLPVSDKLAGEVLSLPCILTLASRIKIRSWMRSRMVSRVKDAAPPSNREVPG